MPDFSAFTLIITASVRQAFYLKDVVPEDCQVITLTDFLAEQVVNGQSSASNNNSVISDFEDKEVWDQIIQQWEKSRQDDLVNRSATARLAKQAFDLLVNYELPDFDTSESTTYETQAMKSWMASYVERISSKGWLTKSLRDAHVISELIEGKIKLPEKTAFYGFHTANKKVSNLLEWANSQGFQHVLCDAKSSVLHAFSYPEITDEVTACARWVKEKTEASSDHKIAVIVPDILKHKALLQEVFDHVLVPRSKYAPLTHEQRPYRLSLGEPLSHYPLVKTFFDIFQLRLSAKFSFDDVSAFLRNPLLGGAKQEWIARAKLEVQLRKLGAKKISWQTLKQSANTAQYNGVNTAYYCPDLVARMEAHETWLSQYGRGRFNYTALADILRQTAHIWGLLDLTDDPQHSEVVTAFFGAEDKGALCDFVRLGHTLSSTTLVSAISKLRRIAQEIHFQPSSGNANIQILSESDALGIPFDAVWMLGLTANNWPTKTQSNPFILHDLQSQHNIPHADAEQELQYAKTTTDLIAHSANTVVMSCHTSEGGEPLRPSSIISDYQAIEAQESSELPYIADAKQAANSHKKVRVIDNFAPKLDMSEDVFGGTGLFKSQALCPFKGFLEHRLSVRPLEMPEVGLSASLRGDVLHTIFEQFWKTVGDHKGLQALELSGALDKTVAQSVAKSMEVYAKRKPDIFSSRIIEVESRRLNPLICQWIRQYELPRAPFENVEVEVSHHVVVKGMSMKVKMDHRDTDSDTGAINIADNKTGQVTAEDWFGERLLEPQVPFYSIVEHDAGHAINSAVFKRIKKDEMSIKGVADIVDTYPKFKPRQGMEGVIDKWRIQIDALAVEYQQGVANISPAKESKSCTYCELKSVCRYHLNS